MQLQATQFDYTRQGVRDLDKIKEPILPVSGGPVPPNARKVNVGEAERAASLLGGGALMGASIGAPSLSSVLIAVVGGALIYRGWSGHCAAYQALGYSTHAGHSAQEMAYRGN